MNSGSQSQRAINIKKFHTNQIMIHEHSNTSTPTFTVFLPGYIKLKVKNISFFDLYQTQMEINCTVSLTIYYGDLPHQIVRYLQRNVYMIVEEDEAIRLGAHEIDQEIVFRENEELKEFNYVLRKNLPIKDIHSYLFLTPYEIIDCILTINVRVTPLYDNLPVIYFKINMMDDGNNYDNKFVYTKELNVQNYGFAEKRRHIQFSRNGQPLPLLRFNKNIYNCSCLQTNPEDNDDQNQVGDNNENIEQYRFIHYHFPLYKFPTVTIGTIFLPLLILTLINLSIFFQSNILSERIANIAMLMIAFLALIPVVHTQMPLQKLTLLQLLVYFQISTTILCLIDSVIIGTIPQEQFKFQPFDDAFFITTLVISIIIFSIVVTLFFINAFCWNNEHRESHKKFGKFRKMPVYRENWNKNIACNESFSYISNELTVQFGNQDHFFEYLSILKINERQRSFILHDTSH